MRYALARHQRCDRTTRRVGSKNDPIVRKPPNLRTSLRRGTSQDAGVSLARPPAPPRLHSTARAGLRDKIGQIPLATRSGGAGGRAPARPGWEAHARRRHLGPALRARRPGPRLVRRSASPAARPPRSGWPGRRSPRARTCSWSRRPGRARRSPRSWRSSTGSIASTPPGTLEPGLRCVYVSPLRSLGYDIERNLAGPARRDPARPRAGRQPGHGRRPDRRHLGLPPPEAPRRAAAPADHHAREPLADAQPAGLARRPGEGVGHLIVDEVHALVPTKRGADLAVSLERLAGRAAARPGPRRPLGDLPARRAGRAVPGRADPRLAGSSRPRCPRARPARTSTSSRCSSPTRPRTGA